MMKFFKKLIERFRNKESKYIKEESYTVTTIDKSRSEEWCIYLCCHKKEFSDRLITKMIMHKHEIDWNIVSKFLDFHCHPKTINFLKYYLNWDILSCKNMSDEDVEMYQDFIDWSSFCRYQIMDEIMVEKYIHKINLEIVILYQVFSKEFLMKHKNKIKNQMCYHKQHSWSDY